MNTSITARWVLPTAISLVALFASRAFAQPTGPGYAITYGSGGYVSVSSGKIPSIGDFTVECWARLDGVSGNAEIISQGSSGNAFYIGLNAIDGTLSLGDGWRTTSVPYPFGNAWHHLAVVRTAASASFYVDGVLKTNRTSAIPNPAPSEMRFGRQYQGGLEIGQWEGPIDEMRIWNTARTQTQITNNMHHVLVGNEAALVSYWRFDEDSGYSTFDTVGGTAAQVINPASFPWFASTVPFVPGAATSNAINVTATSASLKGTVYFNSSLTAAWFDWGTNISYGNQTAFAFGGGGPGGNLFSANLSNLAPAQVYQFRLVASNAFGITLGTNRAFTTLSTNANLGSLTTTAGALVPAFDPGITNYASSDPSGRSNVTVTATSSDHNASILLIHDGGYSTLLSGFPSPPLALNVGPNDFPIIVIAQDGAPKTYTLTVTRSVPPSARTLPAAGITSLGATLNGTVNPNYKPTTAWFDWGLTIAYGNTANAANLAADAGQVQLQTILSGLSSGAAYHYRMAAVNGDGAMVGADQTFQTVPPTNLNYALSAVVSESSTAYHGEAARAIDGNTDGDFADGSVAQTAGSENPAWWQVDLGTMKSIGGVRVWFRTDCCPNQADNFLLRIMDSLSNTVAVQQYTGSPPRNVRFNFPVSVAGQVVRIQSSGNPGGLLSLAEVEVFAPAPAGSILITQDNPSLVTAEVNHAAVFGPVVAVVGEDLKDQLTYQWQQDGVDIPGANAQSCATPVLTLADSGKHYACRLSLPGQSVTSAVGTLSVIPDGTPPYLVGITFADFGTSDNSSINSLKATLLFSEYMDAASLANISNYSFDAGLIVAAVANPDQQSVTLTIRGIAPPASNYSLVATSLFDASSNALGTVTNSGTIPFYAINHALTGAASQSSKGLGTGPEKAIDGNTDGDAAHGSLAQNAAPESPGWWEVDLGGAKAIGQVHLWFRSDCCNGLAGISGPARDDNFTLKVLNASRTVLWSTTYAGTPPLDVLFNLSSPMQGRYVRFESQTPLTTSDGIFSLAEVQVLAPYANVSIFEGIASSGTSPSAPGATAEENHTAKFGPVTPQVEGAPQDQVTFQWQRNGIDIPGATAAAYTTPPLRLSNNGDIYRCRLSLSGTNITGVNWTLSVIPDRTSPRVLGLRFDEPAVDNLLQVTVSFSEPMSSVGLFNRTNYHFTGGTILNQFTLSPDRTSVSFVLLPLVASNGLYSMTVSGLFDLKGNSVGAVPTFSGVLPFIPNGPTLPGTASQSSIGYGADPQRALDGNIDGNFSNASVTHNSPPEKGGWWEDNLGSPQYIGRIHVWFRTDCCTNRQDNFTLKVLDAQRKVIWQSTYPGRPPTDVGFNLVPAVQGQFVRFEASVPEIDEGAFSLAEVQVFPPYVAKLIHPVTPKLSAVVQGSDVVLSWKGIGTLQTASSPAGPWITVANATSPYQALRHPASFFRLPFESANSGFLQGFFITIDNIDPPEAWPNQPVDVHYTLYNRLSKTRSGYINGYVSRADSPRILTTDFDAQPFTIAPHSEMKGILTLKKWETPYLPPLGGTGPFGEIIGGADQIYGRPGQDPLVPNPIFQPPGAFDMVLQAWEPNPEGQSTGVSLGAISYDLTATDYEPIDIYAPCDDSVYSDFSHPAIGVIVGFWFYDSYSLDDGARWHFYDKWSLPLNPDGSVNTDQPVRLKINWFAVGGLMPPYRSHPGSISRIVLAGPGVDGQVLSPDNYWHGAGSVEFFWYKPGQLPPEAFADPPQVDSPHWTWAQPFGILVSGNCGDRTDSVPLKTVTIQPNIPPPQPPTVDFKATPSDGGGPNANIDRGASAVLNWTVGNCPSCNVSIQGENIDHQILFNIKHLPSSSTFKVTPDRNTFYTLTASGNNGSADPVRREVGVEPQSSTPQGSVFWLQMTNPQSSITPCFMVAVFAQDCAAAVQIAEFYNGGYTAECMSESEAATGCP